MAFLFPRESLLLFLGFSEGHSLPGCWIAKPHQGLARNGLSLDHLDHGLALAVPRGLLQSSWPTIFSEHQVYHPYFHLDIPERFHDMLPAHS